MSKSYGLAGLRVGWIVCRDRQLLERLEKCKHYTTICNAAPSEALATIALRARDKIHQRNKTIIKNNLILFDEFFSRWQEHFEWYHPDGGCTVFPRYTGPGNVETFCSDLVE